MSAKKPAQTKRSSTSADARPAQARHWDARLSHKVVHTLVTIAVTLVVFGGGAAAYMFFVRDTQATIVNKDVSGTIRTVEAVEAVKGKFDEAFFTFELPGDWKRLPPDLSGPFKKYSYQSGAKNAENRYLYIYADGLPRDMAVNKAVAVRSEGDKLSHGMVSENCATFTAETSPRQLKVLAKWDGVDFLCDMDVRMRNVVGTSAPGSINKVTLTSATSFTPHDFFVVYEDNNHTPDYHIFYDMLDSLKVK